jgi:phospholipase C
MQIDHVVVLMLENNSFDRMPGWMPGVDGVNLALWEKTLLVVLYDEHGGFEGYPRRSPRERRGRLQPGEEWPIRS